MERKQDPFPQERAAAKQSVVGGEVGEGTKKERAKRIKAAAGEDGSRTRVECVPTTKTTIDNQLAL